MVELTHKRIGLAAILVLAAGVFPVQAQETDKATEQEADSETADQTESVEQAEQTEPAEPAESADGTAAVEERRHVTGSRISRTVSDEDRRQGRRLDTFAPVDVYTREELESTGQIDMGRALRRLDPNIRGGF